MLRELKWFTLEQRRNQASLTMLHKIHNKQVNVNHSHLTTCSEIRLGQGPWPVARLAQLVKQRTDVPRVVGSSPTPGTNTFLPNVTLLVSEVIRRCAWRPEWQRGRECSEIRLGQGPWPVARLAQLVEQQTGVPRFVGSSPTPGTNTFLPNVTLNYTKQYIPYSSLKNKTPHKLILSMDYKTLERTTDWD